MGEYTIARSSIGRRSEAMVDEPFAGVLDYAVARADLETVAVAADEVVLGAALAAQASKTDGREVRWLARRSIQRELRQAGVKVARTHLTALPVDMLNRDVGQTKRVAGVLGRLALHRSRFAHRALYCRETDPRPTLIEGSLIRS